MANFYESPTIKSSSFNFAVETLPYLYQSEYFNFAWGKEHRGFYVLPNGDKYTYNKPTHWNFYKSKSNPPLNVAWGDETDLTITPELVIENLHNCTKINSWFSFLKSRLQLKDDTLSDLLKSEVKDYGQQANDAGIRSSVLLIYDSELHLYNRILLYAYGDRKAVNNSPHAKRLTGRFGNQIQDK